MKKIILHPLQGIEFENGELLKFGTSKMEIIKSLGKPSGGNDKQMYYDELECRIDLDNSENIEFIEFIYGPNPQKSELQLYGINPFQIESDKLIDLLSKHNKGEVDSTEKPYAYAFLESSIGVFREICEIDMDEMISEMKENGEYADNEKWILEDKKKSKYFWTIGIGKKAYYK